MSSLTMEYWDFNPHIEYQWIGKVNLNQIDLNEHISHNAIIESLFLMNNNLEELNCCYIHAYSF
ncbi:CLUMA_CG011280, isoform A [Clunio marinus]|uniref:CLUMA_CG011280, isoform A n=1 Tax=Clunio marinus TaxID=568069 RepID=A0A1J1IHH9_9DIPT|nr:CLUMA_CG011280, isoform A [Clunio marinus]